MRRTVLITGCSSGLGNTSAKKFASEGWNVIATMRKPDERLANENPERILVTRLDVTEPSSIQEAIAAGIARFGQIDVVVNNAGISVPSVFEATPMKVVRSLYETNVYGVMNMIQAITPYLRPTSDMRHSRSLVSTPRPNMPLRGWWSRYRMNWNRNVF